LDFVDDVLFGFCGNVKKEKYTLKAKGVILTFTFANVRKKTI